MAWDSSFLCNFASALAAPRPDQPKRWPRMWGLVDDVGLWRYGAGPGPASATARPGGDEGPPPAGGIPLGLGAPRAKLGWTTPTGVGSPLGPSYGAATDPGGPLATRVEEGAAPELASARPGAAGGMGEPIITIWPGIASAAAQAVQTPFFEWAQPTILPGGI